MQLSRSTLAAAVAMAAAAPAAFGQQPTTPPTPPDPAPLEVGTMAPDFTLSGSTRYGVLKDAIHLSDFRGKTVILAFYFKARTRG